MKSVYLTTASFIALFATTAQGQTAPGLTPNVPANAQASRPTADRGAPGPVAEGSTLAEVVVTATKVETNVQKTPQSIATLDAGLLQRAGVSDVQQLNKLVGGLQIEQNGSSSSIYIRGVGSRVLSPTNDPAVAFSVDGVYFARATGQSTALYDLSRIEVVKGPQGTLYGRNATGGAVNVITNAPKLGVYHLDAELEVGDYDAVRAMVALNAPMGDKAAVRFAAQSTSHDGYLSDGYNDDDTRAMRLSLAYKPSDRLSFSFSADYAHQGGRGAGTVPVGSGANNNALTTRFVSPSDPWTGPSDPKINAFLHLAAPAGALPVPIPGVYCAGVPFSTGGPPPTNLAGAPAIPLCGYPLGVPDINDRGYINNSFYGASGTMQADVGLGLLTLIGGYRRTEIDTDFRVDPGEQSQQASVDQYSGELRLASKPGHGRLTWLAGAFYLHESQDTALFNSNNNSAIPNPVALPGSPLPVTRCIGPLDPDGPGPQPPIPGLCLAQASVIQAGTHFVDPAVTDETYAGFGQATFSLTSRLRLTGGLRYTHEEKGEENGLITSVYTAPQGVTVSYPSQGSVSFNDTSYRAGVEFDLAPRSLLYAHYSTAFHAGGFNLGVPNGPNPYAYQPEKVKSYVVGAKNRFLDNTLQLNVEGFWLDYDNYQQQRLGRVNDGSLACSTLGITLACPLTLRTENAAQARIRGVEADMVWRVFGNGTFNLNLLYNDTRFLTFKLADPFSGAITDYSGKRLPSATPFTATGGYIHQFPLANGARIVAEVRTQYKADTWMWYVHVPGNFQSGYTRTDLSLSYEPPSARWSVTAFVRNVEDKATTLQGGPVDQTTGAVWTNLNPPRTFGLNFGLHL